MSVALVLAVTAAVVALVWSAVRAIRSGKGKRLRP